MVRFIPCWILTTSQISDYLPPECLFDLVIIDEASRSDGTVLPGILRGRQWLVVGDGKRVSPIEAFMAEDELDKLRAALPFRQAASHLCFEPGDEEEFRKALPGVKGVNTNTRLRYRSHFGTFDFKRRLSTVSPFSVGVRSAHQQRHYFSHRITRGMPARAHGTWNTTRSNLCLING